MFKVKELLINCIFEAQVPSFDYNSFFKTTKLIHASNFKSPLCRYSLGFSSTNYASPLTIYALGYCIANSTPNTRWSLNLVRAWFT